MEKYKPIQLHPDNPHYFLFRGKPTILFTAGEHYSMAMNRSFDYIKYLDTLQSLGFNHSRVYTGVKRERPGEYAIDGNALAVEAKDFICPWKRTNIPGALDGGFKYDLEQWNEEYFARWKDILVEAGKRNIELEIILHGPLHMGWDNVGPWGVCPLNIANNINGVGDMDYCDVLTMKNPEMVKILDKYMVKMINELNEFDNFHYECTNEPYTYTTMEQVWAKTYDDKSLRLEWQQHVADVIYETEKLLPNQHLISSNYLNGFCIIDRPIRHVDLYSFHYTHPMVVERNYHLDVAIGMNETGIMTSGKYVRQCWHTVLGGLALYNMLDYSFTPGHEDGTYCLLPSNPAYTKEDGKTLRAGLKVVNDFINTFDFIKMRPALDLLVYDSGLNFEVSVLAEENEQYAVYHVDTHHSHAYHSVSLGLKASKGNYCVEIIDPKVGKVIQSTVENADQGYISVVWFTEERHETNVEEEIAVRIKRIHEDGGKKSC